MKRGGGRGGRGGGGKGTWRNEGSNVVVEPHRHGGVFIAKGKEDALCTKNLVPGEAVYNEKRITVQSEDGIKVEYRVWNPFRSKLAAAILAGVDDIWIPVFKARGVGFYTLSLCPLTFAMSTILWNVFC